MTEQQIEEALIEKLVDLKYTYRPDIHDRATLEQNFREKFEALNRVRLTDTEFARLLGEIIAPDVFTAAKTLRSINAFTRDDGTPLNYTLVNIKDWCKNDFEVISQLRMNTENSNQRYDIILLINGLPDILGNLLPCMDPSSPVTSCYRAYVKHFRPDLVIPENPR